MTDNINRGIINIGNTCYLNTILQCLFYLEPFTKCILETNFKVDATVCLQLQNIFQEMHKGISILKPISFIRYLHEKIKHFNILQQNDANEFLFLLLDVISNEVIFDNSKPMLDKLETIKYNSTAYHQHKKKMDIHWCYNIGRAYSPFTHMFAGQSITQIVCKDCDKIWHTSEIYQDISIAIHGTTIEDCLEHHFHDTILDDWKCDQCKKGQKSIKTTMLWRTPRILIISLKRFVFSNVYSTFTKDNSSVHIPHVLDLNKYTLGPCKQQYELKAVAFHNGSYNGGHYHALCKMNNNEWYIYDDDNITKVDIIEPNVASGYIFFYIKKD